MEDVLNEIKELKQVVIGELTTTQDVISKMNEKVDTIKAQMAKGKGIDALGYYVTQDVIGSGAKAVVYEVTTRDDRKYAMKSIQMHENRLTPDMAREISILFDIKHSSVVDLEEVYSCGDKLYLIMEHAGEDLNTFLQLNGAQNVEITKLWTSYTKEA